MRLSEAFDRQNNNVFLMKLVAAIMMSVSQAYYISLGQPDSEPLLETTGLTLWKHAFIVFFGLGGFLLLSSWERHPDALRFIAARVLRLGPALLAAAIVTAGLGALFTSLPLTSYADLHALLSYVIQVVVLFDGQANLPGVFGPPAPEDHVITTLWTMKFLMVGILAVFMLGLTRLYRFGSVHAAALIVLILMDTALNGDVPLITVHDAVGHGVRFGLCFALGMAAWRFRANLPMDGRLASAAMLTVFLGMWFGGLPTLAYYVLEIYLALWFAFAICIPKTSLSGIDLSYGLYLYAWPATQAWHMAAPDMSIALLALLGTASGVILAACSWRFVERPAIASRPSLLARLRRLPSSTR